MKYRSNRLEWERRTVGLMIQIYCRNHHKHKQNICDNCKELAEYCEQKLSKCPFKENKPACSECQIHCYLPEMRKRIREVMRYSGPRMLYRHPILAILHLLETKRKRNKTDFCKKN